MDYAGLKQAVEDWLNKPEVTEAIPTFIELAEARFNRELRTSAMETRITPSVSSGTYTLPADWLETIMFSVLGSSGREQPLQFIDPAEYAIQARSVVSGDARYYTQIGTTYYILNAPTSATTFYLSYRQKIPALTAQNTSNWLLAKSPDLYLYSTLLQAEPYLQNDARVPLWAAGVSKTIADMNLESDKARQPRGHLATRRATFG